MNELPDSRLVRPPAARWREVALGLGLGVASACGDGDGEDGADATSDQDDTSAETGGDDGGDDGGGADGGDGAGAPQIGSSECELGMAVTGAVAWSTPSTPACAIPFGPETGIMMGYVFIDGSMQAVQIDVDGVAEGGVGAFAATVTMTHVDGRSWTTEACTVVIQTHAPDPEYDDEFSRSYRVHATGMCTEPATDEAGAESIAVAPFRLRFPARWA